jgi:hypothetical protein
MDKIQAVFESSAGLRNWLHAFFWLTWASSNYRTFDCRAGPFGGQYRHLTGPAGVGLFLARFMFLQVVKLAESHKNRRNFTEKWVNILNKIL